MYNDPGQPQSPNPYGQPPDYQNPYEQPQSPYPYGQPPYQQPQPYAATQYGAPPYVPPQVPGYAQAQPKKSNRTLWIVLGIIGGVLLLACGGCALVFGLIGKGVQNTVNTVSTSIDQTATAVSAEGAQVTAQAYYAAIQAQDYTTAYSYLASGLVTSSGQTLTQDLYTQAATSRDTSLGQVTNFSIAADPNDPNSITVTVTRAQGSTYTVHLKFTFTSDGWKITSYDEI
ncbi:MAG TPA: hypothetical protein VKV20_00415 [Ktedonobacteraceae bacterium]|jgi:hypothetical protein|nr:hypothetical protein [Ktedonobacteraceae bacterium]